ncbi:MAG: hypothetical protein QM781_19320 [Chitinophagaceae bacterium]
MTHLAVFAKNNQISMKQLAIFLSAFFLYTQACAQAILFEPGTISNNDAFASSLSPDGKEFYFVKSYRGRSRLEIWMSEKKKQKWQAPAPVFDSLPYRYIDPFITPDGKTLLFNSDHPAPGAVATRRFHIWKAERSNQGWSKPVYMYQLNSDSADFFATADTRGNIYFSSARDGKAGTTRIFIAKKEHDQLSDPVALDTIINASGTESNPFIAADGSYLIFLRSDGKGFGDSDLYISFRKANGEWGHPVNMGAEINTDKGEFAPFVSADNNVLFFTRIVRGQPHSENIFYLSGFGQYLSRLKKDAGE